jgi:hypothetical protein
LIGNLESYDDDDLINEVKEYNPELLEEWYDVTQIQVAQ